MTTIDYRTIPGIFMQEGDRILIKNLSARVASMFSPCHIVHIGIGWGGSMYCSRVGAPTSLIYGVDLVGDNLLKGTDENKYELDLQVIRGDSREVWREFDKPIHFLYIDGDHGYSCVGSDIANWTPMIAPNGFVAFHDCKGSHWSEDVNKALDQYMHEDVWKYMGISGWSRYFKRRV